MIELNTFSIVARCARTGELGVAVATAVPAVGSICPYVQPGIGAVSTQSWVNPYLAIAVLNELARGEPAQAALDAALAADGARELRQIGVVDASGHAAVFTGGDCTPSAGHRLGHAFAVQGNMLVGPETLDAMVAAYEDSEHEDLAERLMRSLEAGQVAGGDKRGKQSAALKVLADQSYPLLDVRVDEHPSPVVELRRVLTIARQQLSPFIAGMPRRGFAAEGLPSDVSAMLLLTPPQRPGGGGSGLEPGDSSSDMHGRDAFIRKVVGLDLHSERLNVVLDAFAPILSEISKLRSLDLTDIHPAVIFDPVVLSRPVP